MKISRCVLTLMLMGACMVPVVPARASIFGGVGTYFQDRINDFADIFRARGGIPNNARSVGIKARATMFVQAGFVHFDGDYYGIERRSIGKVEELRTEGGVSIFYGSNTEMVPMFGNTFMMGDEEWAKVSTRTLVRYLAARDDGRRRPFSLGLELALPVMAVDLGLYPTELFDFAIGFTTIDLYRDDRLFQTSLRPEAPAKVPPHPDVEAPYRDTRERFAELQEKFDEMEMEEQMGEFSQIEGEGRPITIQAPEGGIPDDAADEMDEELDRMESEDEDSSSSESFELPEEINGDEDTSGANASTEQAEEDNRVQQAIERQEEALRRQQERLEREAAEAEQNAD